MFNPLFRPVVGGAERQMERLAVALTRLGASVRVLTVRMEPQWPVEEATADGVRVRRIPFDDICRKFPRARGLGPLNSLLLKRSITKEITAVADGFDVLHAFNASQPSTAFAVRAARAARLTTLVRAINTGQWFDLAVLRAQPLWGSIAKRWFLGNTDCWIAISDAVARELETAGIDRNRIRHLPNGAVIPETAVPLPDRASRFLHVGRISDTAPRDISGLIRAFDVVAAERPEIELAIVGDGNQLESIRAAAKACQAKDRIHLPGEGDADTWIRRSHCLIQPSFSEGMSNSVLEAMAAGLACIAYDIAPNREALDGGSAGILVPVADHGRLAEAIRSLATERGRASELGGMARARAEQVYDIRHVARDTMTLYGELIAASSAARSCV
jgi:L-malate glycosyltransferase